jgi:hypothetical protein
LLWAGAAVLVWPSPEIDEIKPMRSAVAILYDGIKLLSRLACMGLIHAAQEPSCVFHSESEKWLVLSRAKPVKPDIIMRNFD